MRPLLLFASMLVALAAAGCGGGTETSMPPETETSAPPETQAETAPEIEGTTINGEPLSLADFRGRPVFVNVWSSW